MFLRGQGKLYGSGKYEHYWCFIVPHPPIILPEVGCGEEKKIYKTWRLTRSCPKDCCIKAGYNYIIITSCNTLCRLFSYLTREQASGDLEIRVYNVIARNTTRICSKLTEFAQPEGFPAEPVEKEPDQDVDSPVFYQPYLYRLQDCKNWTFRSIPAWTLQVWENNKENYWKARKKNCIYSQRGFVSQAISRRTIWVCTGRTGVWQNSYKSDG